VDSPPDPETLEAYVTGALTGERLAAFEGSVRSDPNAFAALVAFKDAYFGLGRKRAPTWSPPPSARQELGTLTVRSYGGRMELRWDSEEPIRTRAALRMAMSAEIIDFRRPSESDRLRAKRREIQGRELQELLQFIEDAIRDNQSISRDLDRLRSDFIMAAKSEDPDTPARLRRSIGELLEQMDISRSMLGSVSLMLRGVDDRLEAAAATLRDAEPDRDAGRNAGADEVEIPTAAAHLWFGADPRREGGLALRIQPISREAAEFTWIRPGVDFELLAPAPGRGVPLGVIDGEAMLLITRPGARSQVIRVRAEGARPG
jgi:hypothetical protein